VIGYEKFNEEFGQLLQIIYYIAFEKLDNIHENHDCCYGIIDCLLLFFIQQLPGDSKRL